MSTYPAKLLLFGEYTIVKGSEALAMPLPALGGHWAFAKKGQDHQALQQSLPELWEYLQALDTSGETLTALDLPAFQQDLSQGLFFESTIPGGYGAGSSGALCAAIYDRYLLEPLHSDLAKLRKQLAQIESFFHGASSGTDPLISYLRAAVHLQSKDLLTKVSLPPISPSNPTFFLIDTQKARKTAPLVQLFLEKCQEATFLSNGLSPLIVANHQAIPAFLLGDWEALQPAFRQISQLQLDYFQEMIPAAYRSVWTQGLAEQKYLLKLCGAGGGGFILGMTKDWEASQVALAHLKVRQIHLVSV